MKTAEIGKPRKLPGTQDGAEQSNFILAAIALVILAQVFLVFTKSINWDEFLHFSQIYDLPRGRLIWPTQTLHARLFAWAPLVSTDVIVQLEAARLGMLVFETVAACLVILISREFVDRQSSLLCGLAYLTGGYVFEHGFSFRPDPMATATLMTALYLLARRELSLLTVVVSGSLIGVAGVMTIKSIFYLPCFAGATWLRFVNRPDRRAGTIAAFAAAPLIAVLVFYAVMTLHGQGMASANTIATDKHVVPSNIGSATDTFLLGGLFNGISYVVVEALIAPMVTIGILALPLAWSRYSTSQKVMLAGLLAPLATIIFYRNVVAYHFVFLLPPICVAISPSIAAISRRYGGPLKLLPIMLASPAIILATQSYHVLPRQHALIDKVHELFPKDTGYLSFTGFVPDYPRILPGLLVGAGLQGYYRSGTPVIADEIESGNVGFVLADIPPIEVGLEGRRVSGTLQPADFSALNGNFLHYAGNLWIAGKMLCPTNDSQHISIVRPGFYSIDGDGVTVDGKQLIRGSNIYLSRGDHRFTNVGESCRKFWALPSVPQLPDRKWDGPVMVGFGISLFSDSTVPIR